MLDLTKVRVALSGKLQQDILWNVGSLAILGVSGILLNVLIGVFYDAATLGIFNQVFAAYLFCSQFATGGIHYSVLKYMAEYADDRRQCARILLAAILATVLLAAACCGLFWMLAGPVSTFLDSPGVAQGMLWATPGLFFYALNKILLGTLNGLRRMRAFACLSALRPILLIGSLFIAALAGAPGEILAGAFSVAEAILCCVAAWAVRPHFALRCGQLATWLRKHFDFGLKSFVSGALIELNTRVDVLMLGYFASDGLVGIYSFAAIWAEGLTHLLFVLRNNFNPILVQLIARRELDQLRRFVTRGKLITYGVTLLLGVVGTLLYPIIVDWFSNKPEFMDSWLIFGILVAGIVLSSGYFPFGTILLQAGRPGLHTAMILACVTFNVAINALLIPLWSAPGAAIATAGSFVFSVVLLVWFTRATVGVRL